MVLPDNRTLVVGILFVLAIVWLLFYVVPVPNPLRTWLAVGLAIVLFLVLLVIFGIL